MRTLPCVDLRTLDGTACDVLVRAGGLGAAALAYETARRGIRVVAVLGDPDALTATPSLLAADLPMDATGLAAAAGGTSAGAERGEVTRLAAVWRERLLRAASHLVRPQPLLVDLSGVPGLDPQRLADFVRTARAEVEDSTLPEPVVLDGGTGLEVWEARADVPRLAWSLWRAAAAHGAVLLGDVEMEVGGSDGGVQLRADGPSGPVEARVEAGHVVEGPGPSTDRLAVRDASFAESTGSDDWGAVRIAAGAGLEVVVPWTACGREERCRFVRADDDGSGEAAHSDALASPAASELARAERLAVELCRASGAAPSSAELRRWRAGFAFLPGGELPFDPDDPLWLRLGAESVVVRAEAGDDALLEAEVRHAVDALGAWSVEVCALLVGWRRAGFDDAARDRVRAAFARRRHSAR